MNLEHFTCDLVVPPNREALSAAIAVRSAAWRRRCGSPCPANHDTPITRTGRHGYNGLRLRRAANHRPSNGIMIAATISGGTPP
ncbi:hypothetical protein GCM10010994_08900 [Chelatococcus reniformis]|uniref:Uncharacterized protein n=1 Tax=Chelatococcus reniformis TaxID=1494448 RepID=A0A916X8J0_9HYPH|nr:hypothetical protein GCM10010994_08900 [Chelatococcus reniformis]